MIKTLTNCPGIFTIVHGHVLGVHRDDVRVVTQEVYPWPTGGRVLSVIPVTFWTLISKTLSSFSPRCVKALMRTLIRREKRALWETHEQALVL